MNKDHIDQYIFLADQPQLLPILAGWFYKEWGHHNPESTLASVEHELLGYLNTDRIPLTVARLRGGKPIASASLKIQEMATHPQYLHWLGGVYVHPQYREQGIGSQLVEYSAGLAQELNVSDLYLYTRSHEDFYNRLGWHVIERPVYKNRVVSIMNRNLLVTREKEKSNDK
jgi:GNAT superfamily N-acetyltransferase